MFPGLCCFFVTEFHWTSYCFYSNNFQCSTFSFVSVTCGCFSTSNVTEVRLQWIKRKLLRKPAVILTFIGFLCFKIRKNVKKIDFRIANSRESFFHRLTSSLLRWATAWRSASSSQLFYPDTDSRFHIWNYDSRFHNWIEVFRVKMILGMKFEIMIQD